MLLQQLWTTSSTAVIMVSGAPVRPEVFNTGSPSNFNMYSPIFNGGAPVGASAVQETPLNKRRRRQSVLSTAVAKPGQFSNSGEFVDGHEAVELIQLFTSNLPNKKRAVLCSVADGQAAVEVFPVLDYIGRDDDPSFTIALLGSDAAFALGVNSPLNGYVFGIESDDVICHFCRVSSKVNPYALSADKKRTSTTSLKFDLPDEDISFFSASSIRDSLAVMPVVVEATRIDNTM